MFCASFSSKLVLPPDVPQWRGAQHAQARVDHKHEAEEENRGVGGHGDGPDQSQLSIVNCPPITDQYWQHSPVFLGQEVQAEGVQELGGQQRPGQVEREAGVRPQPQHEPVHCNQQPAVRAASGHSRSGHLYLYVPALLGVGAGLCWDSASLLRLFHLMLSSALTWADV